MKKNYKNKINTFFYLNKVDFAESKSTKNFLFLSFMYSNIFVKSFFFASARGCTVLFTGNLVESSLSTVTSGFITRMRSKSAELSTLRLHLTYCKSVFSTRSQEACKIASFDVLRDFPLASQKSKMSFSPKSKTLNGCAGLADLIISFTSVMVSYFTTLDRFSIIAKSLVSSRKAVT